jgi:hypothetical protein
MAAESTNLDADLKYRGNGRLINLLERMIRWNGTGARYLRASLTDCIYFLSGQLYEGQRFSLLIIVKSDDFLNAGQRLQKNCQ